MKSRIVELWIGFASGSFGYLVAMCLFTQFAFFVGMADAADQVGSGLGFAQMAAFVATVLVAVFAWRGRRVRPDRSIGLVIGAALGMALLVYLHLRVLPVLEQLPSGCNCDPLFDQMVPGEP